MTNDNSHAESGNPTIHPIDEDRAIDDLKPHPRNHEVFPELSETQLQSLAEDIAAHGLKYSVEILLDGTIVAGHQRWRALRLLGNTTVPCRVLHGLEAAGPAAVVAWMIRDNLHRRQLRNYPEMLSLFFSR